MVAQIIVKLHEGGVKPELEFKCDGQPYDVIQLMAYTNVAISQMSGIPLLKLLNVTKKISTAVNDAGIIMVDVSALDHRQPGK